jgi:hypothetical protein
MPKLIISGFELEGLGCEVDPLRTDCVNSIRRTRLGDGIEARLMKFENFLTWW